jgi:hypothetical protein
VFDRVQTCDNHCPFCFIHQLPKGMRRSLYLKDDDYRLSFLYGNFTTLTRFTEADLERVITEKLSPLYVSIHATDPEVRTRLLRNRRGATSLRWLELLLDAGVEVHGQVVVCPGRQRRRGARRHAARRARPVPQARDGRCRAARCERAQPRARDAPAHRGRGARGRRHRRRVAGTFRRRARPPARVRLRRVLPARGASSRRSTRTTTAAARERHRHGAHVRSRGARRARRRRRGPTGTRRVLRRVDGAPAEGYRAPRTRTNCA